MATKRVPCRGPPAMTEGYSISGSQANSVALKPGGTFSGGKRFSVAGPGRGAAPAPQERTQARATPQAPADRTQRMADRITTPLVRIPRVRWHQTDSFVGLAQCNQRPLD